MFVILYLTWPDSFFIFLSQWKESLTQRHVTPRHAPTLVFFVKCTQISTAYTFTYFRGRHMCHTRDCRRSSAPVFRKFSPHRPIVAALCNVWIRILAIAAEARTRKMKNKARSDYGCGFNLHLSKVHLRLRTGLRLNLQLDFFTFLPLR